MQLEPRSRAILNAIVASYIDDAQPVSSATVAERLPHLSLSSATIRSVMVELEEQGLLQQPHTSAGRIPTELGMRTYLDGLDALKLKRADRAKLEALTAAIAPGALPTTLGQSLADLSGQVAVVGVPRFVGTRFKEVALVRYDAHRFVAFFVSQGGLIQQKLVEMAFEVAAEDLQQAQNFLNDKLQSLTVAELRGLIRMELTQHQVVAENLKREALEIGARVLPEPHGNSQLNLIVEGASHLVGQPEFNDPKHLRALLGALEDRSALLTLLDRIVDGAGVKVVLGSEHQVQGLGDVACVGAALPGPNGETAAVTLLGPVRMDYVRLVPLVDFATKLFGRYWE